MTNATPEIGDYPFTTRIPYPAMMKYKNIQIQLVDTPPITKDYMESWLPELIKVTDRVLIVLDLAAPDTPDVLMSILAKLEEKNLTFFSDPKKHQEESGLFLKKTLIIANKKDAVSDERNLADLKEFFGNKLDIISVSASEGEGIEKLRKIIFQMLDIIRVYSKIPGKKPDLEDPFTLKSGSSVMDMAKAVHKDFWFKLKFARIWSKNTYQGQKANRDHILEDEDILELHI